MVPAVAAESQKDCGVAKVWSETDQAPTLIGDAPQKLDFRDTGQMVWPPPLKLSPIMKAPSKAHASIRMGKKAIGEGPRF